MGKLQAYASKVKQNIEAGISNFISGQPIDAVRHGMDVVSQVYYSSVGSDAAEADSTAKVINATNHSAQEGDVIKMTSGNTAGQERFVQKTDTNTITLAAELSEAPAATDTFDIIRPAKPTVSSTGAIEVESGSFSPIDASGSGKGLRTDYSSTNVTTSEWVELIASTAAIIRKMEIIDTGGEVMEIALGGLGSEVREILVPRGGNGTIEVDIPAGTRISIQAVTADVSLGDLIINFYG